MDISLNLTGDREDIKQDPRSRTRPVQVQMANKFEAQVNEERKHLELGLGLGFLIPCASRTPV